MVPLLFIYLDRAVRLSTAEGGPSVGAKNAEEDIREASRYVAVINSPSYSSLSVHSALYLYVMCDICIYIYIYIYKYKYISYNVVHRPDSSDHNVATSTSMLQLRSDRSLIIN